MTKDDLVKGLRITAKEVRRQSKFAWHFKDIAPSTQSSRSPRLNNYQFAKFLYALANVIEKDLTC